MNKLIISRNGVGKIKKKFELFLLGFLFFVYGCLDYSLFVLANLKNILHLITYLILISYSNLEYESLTNYINSTKYTFNMKLLIKINKKICNALFTYNYLLKNYKYLYKSKHSPLYCWLRIRFSVQHTTTGKLIIYNLIIRGPYIH